MSVLGRWGLGALLASEALYLLGIVAVVVPFGLAMDAFDDREPNLPACRRRVLLRHGNWMRQASQR